MNATYRTALTKLFLASRVIELMSLQPQYEAIATYIF